ncbi:MAG TPA: hypothetical protein G4N96_14220, partial [Chloroflexi bacterium]|nr:hypothetical protein [Chloroflexota bacterium]
MANGEWRICEFANLRMTNLRETSFAHSPFAHSLILKEDFMGQPAARMGDSTSHGGV